MPQGRKIASFGREYQDRQTRSEDQRGTQGRSRYRDRRRFCKGKEGVPHVWTLGRVYDMPWMRKKFHTEVCANCGKKRFRDGVVLTTFPRISWDGELELITRAELATLPKGTVLGCIDGQSYEVGKDDINVDTRGDFLAYGFKVKA